MNDPMSTLFVDDDPALLRAVRRSLLGRDIDISTATSGHEALALLAARPVDLLVSDIEMPDMDGLELLAIARARYPFVLRALLSGAATLDRAVRAVNEDQIVRFFAKPFDPDVFVEAIEAITPQIQQSRERGARAAYGERVFSHLRWIEVEHPGVTRLPRTAAGALRIEVGRLLEETARSGSNVVRALALEQTGDRG